MDQTIKKALDTIKLDLSLGGKSPGQLAEIRTNLSGFNQYLSERLIEIKRIKADKWLLIRKGEDIKSDKMADRLWDATPEGKEETELLFTIKAISRMMSAIGSQLRILENEARNMF